jgi:hypothetical protein
MQKILIRGDNYCIIAILIYIMNDLSYISELLPDNNLFIIVYSVDFLIIV